MEKLKKRWGLKTNWDLFAVLCVFSVNGSFAAYIGKPMFNFLNFTLDTVNPWLYYPLRFIIIFVVYQLTFPIVGWLFGQFNFAWSFEKKFLSKMGLGFLFKSQKKTI